MGKRYRQLSLEDRWEIARLCAEGATVRQVAATLDRPPSTIARELKRNRAKRGGYQADYAELQARARRWSGSRLERDEGLRNAVLARLVLGWSPEQIANRLPMEEPGLTTSHESIYRFIYGQIARRKDYSWRKLLRRGKWRRGRRRRGGSSSARTILHRRPLSERPASVADRREFGHWEADVMQFGRSKQTVVLMLHERHSRLLIAVWQPSMAAAPMADAMAAILGPLPPEFRQTVTFDNGREFAHHYKLHDHGIETYFCDTYSPWQKGGVENAIERMRWWLPHKTDVGVLSNGQFAVPLQAYNNTPRKCLGYRTPAEVVRDQVLHFECEFTFPPPQERRGTPPRRPINPHPNPLPRLGEGSRRLSTPRPR